MMYTILLPFISSILPLLGIATTIPSTESSLLNARTTNVPARLSIEADHLGQPKIDKLPMQAADSAFWLGGSPVTYCPTVVGDKCPPGKDTVISGLESMNVLVPGGQRIHVKPSGALGFTQAHSASIPPGSYVGGFKYEPLNETSGTFHFGGWGASTLMACPHPGKEWYQVFANIKNATVPGGKTSDCIIFLARATSYTGPNPAAWQYV